mmetsp:Transcript_93053/g.161276  ORF Transcript_93053/g.161276 Transcript_93053/m.161276 type:complete len:338 (-) Transcript_93053:1052-2065(-)
MGQNTVQGPPGGLGGKQPNGGLDVAQRPTVLPRRLEFRNTPHCGPWDGTFALCVGMDCSPWEIQSAEHGDWKLRAERRTRLGQGHGCQGQGLWMRRTSSEYAGPGWSVPDLDCSPWADRNFPSPFSGGQGLGAGPCVAQCVLASKRVDLVVVFATGCLSRIYNGLKQGNPDQQHLPRWSGPHHLLSDQQGKGQMADGQDPNFSCGRSWIRKHLEVVGIPIISTAQNMALVLLPKIMYNLPTCSPTAPSRWSAPPDLPITIDWNWLGWASTKIALCHPREEQWARHEPATRDTVSTRVRRYSKTPTGPCKGPTTLTGVVPVLVNLARMLIADVRTVAN